MEFIGVFNNTHGIKGEIRILSDFKYKEEAFKIGNKLNIEGHEYTIKSYRVHKNYDMICFQEVNDINDIIEYKGSKVYINKKYLKNCGVLDSEIIGLEVYDKGKYYGKVVDILKSIKYDMLVIDGIKRHMVPYINQFIKNIDIKNNKIEIEYIEGLVDED